MRAHPQIRASRQGLPLTSNIPWSADEERECRHRILLKLAGMCTCALFGMLSASLAIARDSLVLLVFCVGCVLFTLGFFVDAAKHHQRLYAMMLNKPRDPRSLTLWIEYSWAGVHPLARTFICKCGRVIELWKATYFRESNRYAAVCECGVGHFQIPPSEHAKAAHR